MYTKITAWHGNTCHIIGLLCGESTGHQWIPHKMSKWCGALVFSLFLFEQYVEQTVKLPVVWDIMMLMWHHCTVKRSVAWSLLNILRLKQNGRNFADNIFTLILLIKDCWIFIQISLEFIPKGPIDIVPAMVQIINWPVSEPIKV